MVLDLVLLFSVLLSLQSMLTIIWMLYAWEDPEYREKHRSPKKFLPPQYSFTALIPARFEPKVIQDTIRAVDAIDYPEHLKEIVVLCRTDDIHTIAKAREVILSLGKDNIKLVTFSSFPINKPHSLNIGLKQSSKEVIAVFDAEDSPHPQLYHVVNTLMQKKKVQVIQSGVQLVNYASKWFSLLNVLEYFFWFKSGLHFFTNVGNVTPLAGNTVFFKKKWLTKVGGWSETCLTEDAEIGFRLIRSGAKCAVVYDEEHATQEETPATLASFIKQRTRWNQGFIQILLSGSWLLLPGIRKKFFAGYILSAPLVQAVIALYLPVSLWVMYTQKMPVWITEFSFIPLYLVVLQIIIQIVGFREFSKAYVRRFVFLPYLLLPIFFYAYQLVLTFSAFRACFRLIFRKNSWEKTRHLNAHRQEASSERKAYQVTYA